MGKIIVLVGISASGKSTLARELESKTKGVIVSRDGIRSMIYGLSDSDHKEYYQDPELWAREKVVTGIEDSIVKYVLKRGGTVIADNTHLKKEYLDKYKTYGVEVEYILVDEDLFTCLTRDSLRSRSVGDDVIKSQHQKFQNIRKNYDFSPFFPKDSKKSRDPNKKDCMIFDLDGTLTLMNDRTPFEWHRVDEDSTNPPIYEIYQMLSFAQGIMEMDLIIVSGRSDESMEKTVSWLQKYQIPYNRIYLRKSGDYRKDFIVKQEIWNEIEKDYNIICMFDDRDQVVNHARSLGYTVLQVSDCD